MLRSIIGVNPKKNLISNLSFNLSDLGPFLETQAISIWLHQESFLVPPRPTVLRQLRIQWFLGSRLARDHSSSRERLPLLEGRGKRRRTTKKSRLGVEAAWV